MPLDDTSFADLRQRVARLERAVPDAGLETGAAAVLPFGLADLDDALPGGGLALGAVHEVQAGIEARGGAGPAMAFAGGILARRPGSVLWCAALGQGPYGPALAAVGLHPDRVIHVEARNDTEALMVLEEAARQPGLAGVVGAVRHLDLTASRRLQLAAEAAQGLALVLRPPPEGTAVPPTAAATRWQVTPVPTPKLPVRDGMRGVGRARWQLDLLRCRGGAPATWIMEACDAQGRLAVPADLADRSHRPAEEKAGEQIDLFRAVG